MKFSRFIGIALIYLIVSACAKRSENISAQYISPLQYEPFTCTQLAAEARRVSARASQISGVQNKSARSDAVATGVAVVLFWPAAFFVRGNRENQAELARLKGELEAVEQESIRKECGIEFRRS